LHALLKIGAGLALTKFACNEGDHVLAREGRMMQHVKRLSRAVVTPMPRNVSLLLD
jgi:hypothetical protein